MSWFGLNSDLQLSDFSAHLALLRAAPVILLGSVTMNLHLAYRKFVRLNPSSKNNVDVDDNFPKFVHLVGLGLWIAAIGDIAYGLYEFDRSRLYFLFGLAVSALSKAIFAFAVYQRKRLFKELSRSALTIACLLVFLYCWLIFKFAQLSLPLVVVLLFSASANLILLFISWKISQAIPSLRIGSVLFLICDTILLLDQLFNFDRSSKTIYSLFPYYLSQFMWCASTINFSREKLY